MLEEKPSYQVIFHTQKKLKFLRVLFKFSLHLSLSWSLFHFLSFLLYLLCLFCGFFLSPFYLILLFLCLFSTSFPPISLFLSLFSLFSSAYKNYFSLYLSQLVSLRFRIERRCANLSSQRPMREREFRRLKAMIDPPNYLCCPFFLLLLVFLFFSFVLNFIFPNLNFKKSEIENIVTLFEKSHSIAEIIGERKGEREPLVASSETNCASRQRW